MAGGGAGGGAEAGDGHRVKAIATAGDGRRVRSRSVSGGPNRARAGRFRPNTPSYVRRRRRIGCGAKLVDPDEDEIPPGEAVVGQGGTGAGHGAKQDGTAAGA